MILLPSFFCQSCSRKSPRPKSAAFTEERGLGGVIRAAQDIPSPAPQGSSWRRFLASKAR
jgi:hypothetical protein